MSRVGFDDGRTCYFYNAGIDPDARDLSPGRDRAPPRTSRDRHGSRPAAVRLPARRRAYKYEWGAVDEPI